MLQPYWKSQTGSPDQPLTSQKRPLRNSFIKGSTAWLGGPGLRIGELPFGDMLEDLYNMQLDRM